MEQRREPGQCPFLQQKCILDRCELFATVPFIVPGHLLGSMRQGQLMGCAFNLMAQMLGWLNLLATPPPMAGPAPRQ